jgi:nucleoside-diphosphate-sugar epimerase
MIIGTGSESWRMVRDLAARLPVMLLPSWLENKSQPIYIDDVIAAIRHALVMELAGSAAYPLPGPEVLTAREIITRTASLLGLSPRTFRLPFITPRLSSYWIALITRADPNISRQLVEGLRTPLVARDDGFWKLLPGYVRVPFDEAARRALVGEAKTLPLRTRFTEWMIHRLTPSTDKQKPSGAAL